MLDTYIEVAVPVSDYAIIVKPDDNVAVVKTPTFAGRTRSLPNGETVEISNEIPAGHRFATRDIPAREFVRQYGQPIGTSLAIEKGEWITHENMSDDVPVVRNLPDDLHTPAPDYFSPNEIGTFMGFRRPDGRV